MAFQHLNQFFRRFLSTAILVAIASMFVIISCHGESGMKSEGFGYHPDANFCQEHISQLGDTHTDKTFFNVTIPEGKILLAILGIAVFFSLFPTLPERYTSRTKIALVYHQRKRWVWARNLPFSSLKFFPYFAAERDR